MSCYNCHGRMAEQPHIPNVAPIDNLLPSRVARRNQALAYQAIRHVRRQLEVRNLEHPTRDPMHVGREDFSAWLLGRFEQIWAIGHESGRIQQAEEHWSSNTVSHRLAHLARGNRAGAQAALAFSYLLSLAARPLDFMHVPGREHSFVLIGRDDPLHQRAATEADGEPAGTLFTPAAGRVDLKPEEWGADAVVCDPVLGVVYRQVELINTDYYYDYYPAESQLRALIVQEAAFDG